MTDGAPAKDHALTRVRGWARHYGFWGALFGLGSPLGLLAMRFYFTHDQLVADWVRSEIAVNGWYYLYMGVGTVIAMAVLGRRAGRRADTQRSRADRLADRADKLHALAVTDGLTGVYVRRHLIEKLAEELQRAQRYQFSIAGLFIDADNFKAFNETYGHPFGDEVLRRIARVITDSVRDSDIVGRYGGDEFLVMLPHAQARDAMAAAERIRQGVEAQPLEKDGRAVSVTVSVGVIAAIPKDTDVLKFLEIADQALRRSKGLGKNCTILCDLPGTESAPVPADVAVPRQ